MMEKIALLPLAENASHKCCVGGKQRKNDNSSLKRLQEKQLLQDRMWNMDSWYVSLNVSTPIAPSYLLVVWSEQVLHQVHKVLFHSFGGAVKTWYSTGICTSGWGFQLVDRCHIHLCYIQLGFSSLLYSVCWVLLSGRAEKAGIIYIYKCKSSD